MTELEQALERLESDTELPEEAYVYEFVASPHATTHRFARLVPARTCRRWLNAVKRLNADRRRERRVKTPVDCRQCNARFYRSRIQQVRCQTCIDATKKLQNGGAA